MHTETVFYAIVPPLSEAPPDPPFARALEHFYLFDTIVPPGGTHLRRGFCSVGVGVVAPHGSVVEVQVVLLLIASFKTIVLTHNPVEVFRVLTQGAMKLWVHVRVMMFPTPAFKIGRASDLHLLVG
jgi:hypothetical protein